MSKIEQIKSQIILRIPTPNGPTTHGIQFDLGTHKTNIICSLCSDQGKQHFSKTLKEQAKHVLKEHPEIFKTNS